MIAPAAVWLTLTVWGCGARRAAPEPAFPDPVSVAPSERGATLVRKGPDAPTDALQVVLVVNNHSRRVVELDNVAWSASLGALELPAMDFSPARSLGPGQSDEVAVFAHLPAPLFAGLAESPDMVSVLGTLAWQQERGPTRGVPFSFVMPLESL